MDHAEGEVSNILVDYEDMLCMSKMTFIDAASSKDGDLVLCIF
jgi:hypothetical protein